MRALTVLFPNWLAGWNAAVHEIAALDRVDLKNAKELNPDSVVSVLWGTRWKYGMPRDPVAAMNYQAGFLDAVLAAAGE